MQDHPSAPFRLPHRLPLLGCRPTVGDVRLCVAPSPWSSSIPRAYQVLEPYLGKASGEVVLTERLPESHRWPRHAAAVHAPSLARAHSHARPAAPGTVLLGQPNGLRASASQADMLFCWATLRAVFAAPTGQQCRIAARSMDGI
jgi:hypothetical protein